MSTFDEWHLVQNRLGFGVSPSTAFDGKWSLEAHLKAQLSPQSAVEDPALQKISSLPLKIEYSPGESEGKTWAGVSEDRPLSRLNQSQKELWKLADYSTPMSWEERVRPVDELRAATFLRAVYSPWQLREVMVEFWHNHFNVNAYSSEEVGVSLPSYDRDVMRKHWNGNFRILLEEVAKHPAMLYYLNNVSSKASPANENFARELFELHTLGAEHYFNHLYNRWHEVPGALHGKPVGYIDQDVYEAARAFTGWTVANGEDTGRGVILGKTGEFAYFDGWHDPYQKRILATELSSHQAYLADGKKVLDLLAEHPGTARHLCRKLCQRFVSDDPPAKLVSDLAERWLETRNAPDQIALILKDLFRSRHFLESSGRKLKRPFELLVSFFRATEAKLTRLEEIPGALESMGYKPFSWPTPTGHPDALSHWVGTNLLLKRWNYISALAAADGMNTCQINPRSWLDYTAQSAVESSCAVAKRILGRPPSPALVQSIRAWLDKKLENSQEALFMDGEDEDHENLLREVVVLVGCSAEFQLRG